MSGFAWLFEAKSIQRYILDSGRLADLIGASDLVADLCASKGDDLLAEVLHAAEADDLTQSRRAGAALCLHADRREELDRVRALWRLAVGMRMPGLSFTDADPVNGESEGAALRAAYQAQPGLRENDAAFLPPFGGPMTAFNSRTGRVAERREKTHDGEMWRDAVTGAQGARGRALAAQDEPDRLAKSFLPEAKGDRKGYHFPRHFEPDEASARNPAFPFGGSTDQRIAVIHADISGLGQLFRRITKDATTAGQVFSMANGIEAAITRAARGAAGDWLLPNAAKAGDKGFTALFGKDRAPQGAMVVPARPVVLGGDDITIIARADLALGFTRQLLIAIETETKAAFDMLREKQNLALPDLPTEGLTACAGVAVVRVGHPFLAAQNMAEGLCKQAKKVAKDHRSAPYPAFLSFAVITSTIDEDFRHSYRPREQMVARGGDKNPFHLNKKAYKVSGSDDVKGIAFDQLMELARALDGATGHGKLLSALGLFHTDKDAAQRHWKRYRDVLADDPDACEAVKVALTACEAPKKGKEWPKLKKALPVLNDALEIMDIGGVK